MDFRLLGPVEAHAAGRPVDVGQPRQRCVLAALAADVGRPVPVSTLVDRVWGLEAPQGARHALYVYIARIRKLIERAGSAETARVVRRSGGYVLEADPDQVDVHHFRRLVRQSHDQVCPDMQRVVVLRQALALWRGTPLADLPGEWPTRVRQGWHSEYLDSVVAWARAEVHVGNAGHAVALVTELVEQHPTNEVLAATLMRVLHAAGRGADALDCYTRTRVRLVENLGADPGAELQALHRAILRGDSGQVPPGPVSAPAAAVPAHLPPDVRGFTSRVAELNLLDAILGGAGDRPSAVVISALSGTAGVGKTALAVHWAHRVHDRFPDGQLYVDLRGYDSDQPVLPGDALATFLRALGVAGFDIPIEVAERSSRYRTLLNGRRMLVLLDNASSAQQVRPLLPGSAGCLVVVTSRDTLAGLVARDGAHRIDLEVLPLVDAVALLRTLIGARVDAEPDAATTLARQCARLPLALRVAAELAVARFDLPLACLADELADQHRRLDLLDVNGDPQTAVRNVFSWSYRHLPADAARMFRLLGLHFGDDFDAYAAAALADTDLTGARKAIDLLTRAHLIRATGGGRYGMHDLLGAYAAELTATYDGEDKRRDSLTRLFDFYLAAAAAAMDILHPAEQHRRPRIKPPATPTPSMVDPAAALAWLDVERPNLAAVCAYTAVHGWPRHTALLATTMFRYLDVGGHYPDALTIHRHALSAAEQTGDRAGQARALNRLGVVHLQQGRYELAADYIEQSLSLYRLVDDHTGEANALGNLGAVRWRQGRYQLAAEHYREALSRHRLTIGDRTGEGRTLANLGLVYERQGRYAEAIDQHQQALLVSRETGHRSGEAHALGCLGVLYARQGRFASAITHHRESIIIFRSIGDRLGEAYALTDIGKVYRRQGNDEQAVEHHQRGLDLFREIGHRSGQAQALNGLGETLRATGQPDQARVRHAAALALAVEAGDRYEEGGAHTGLAHTFHATRDHEQARQHWHRALAIYLDLNVPDADDVRDHLDELDQA